MIEIPRKILVEIHQHGEVSYPEEGAGFLLGTGGEPRRVTALLSIPNAREDAARHNRYLITPEDYLRGEREADRLGLILLGVFHSHPDHPNQPSEFDREWAQPFFSYLITSVFSGKAADSRAWWLAEDRSVFMEEPIQLTDY